MLNSGTIAGGNGGAAGKHGKTAGLGGAGVIGSDLIIVNDGAINGGFASAGSGVQANAITFTGGDNYLNLNPGGTAGTLSGNIAVTGTLTFNQTYAVTLSNAITGAGSIIQAGPGGLILSGSSSYTGTTTVDNGTLEVDGSVASSSGVIVNSGGTLAGTGTVSSTMVNSGGTLLGGNGTAGTSLAISGNLAFEAGAIYLVQLNPATASFVNVSGAAALGGATVNAAFAPGGYVSKQYTILTAGSISGAFGSLVNTNLPSGFKTSLSYDASHAYLNLSLSFTPPPPSPPTPPPSGPPPPSFAPALSGNQQAVGNALINFFNTTGSIPLVFGGLTPAGLTLISGEGAVGSQQTTFNAMNQFIGVMTDPFIDGRGDNGAPGSGVTPYAGEQALAYAATRSPSDAYAAIYRKAPPQQAYDLRWTMWASAFGGAQATDGNTAQGLNNTTSRLYGVAVGLDYRLSPNTIAGFALAGGGTSFSVVNGGSGRSDLFQAGAFVRHTIGPAYLSGALAYGWQDVTTDRTVTIAGVDRLRAEFNANAWSGRAEGGYRTVTPWLGGVGLTPYAAAQFTTFQLPAYAENVVSGANTFALTYGARNVTDTRSELGLRVDKSVALQTAILTLRGRAAWAHDFNPDRAIGATFQALPGASFVVNGARQASDSALTSASAEMAWLNGWSVAATFDGEFSNVTRSYAGRGTVRYAW
ncbi:MAG: autotransporter domain-containing protein [Pseudomonadota bacterium]